ncbi:MAG: glycosyltransferase family 2 protein [Bryobacterales bacterium]|nr:glycosyltransferase family 2 protein [Bryobacterales bacterium]
MKPNACPLQYVLITPARNEAEYIEKTLESVVHQSVRPLRWIVVENGSTDATASIVARYAQEYTWIQLVLQDKAKGRSFAGKAQAFNAGLEIARELPYDVIGNLDADISFDETFFEFLLQQFAADPELGVAGTVFEEEGYKSETDSFEGRNHVAGQCQLFRRACMEEIGGYVAHRRGGIDWIAVTTARMKGWKTRSFREKSFYHYRHMGTAERGRLAAMFSYGEKDYYLGGHPLWQVFRCAYRATKRPYLTGGVALLAGYVAASVRGMERPVSRELMRFHRREQMLKLKRIFGTLLRLERVDNFDLAK